GRVEDLAGRVVRRVQQQDAGAFVDRPTQLRGVEPPAVGLAAQRDHAPACAGEGDGGGVRVVVRLEGDDLVARAGQREQCGGDRLGGPGGDEHLRVRVV